MWKYWRQILVFKAYRAILAEPRNKATANEDYGAGPSRNDYMGGAEQMNQYALPLCKTKNNANGSHYLSQQSNISVVGMS